MNLGEVRVVSGMPAALIELAFHDSEYDCSFIKRPHWRETVARAITRAALDQLAGTGAVLYPLPVSALALAQSGTRQLTASWQGTPDTLYSGANAVSYRVYLTRYDASGPSSSVSTQSGTSYSFEASPNTRYVLRVAALNDGGESFLSEPVAGFLNSRNQARVLIVNGFDRLDRSVQEEDNSGDYVLRHAQAIEESGDYGYLSASNEAVEAGGSVLGGFAAVDWIAGEEARIGGEATGIPGELESNRALRPADRSALKSYLEGGGTLLISGSELAWDVTVAAQSDYTSFLNNTLKATYVGDDAAEYAFKGVAEGPFAGLSGNFDDGKQGSYDVNYPELLAPNSGATLCMTYATPSKGLGLCYKGTDYRLVYLGVPLETFYPDKTRGAVMKNALAYLLGTVEPPTDGDNDAEPESETDTEVVISPDGDEPDGDSPELEPLLEEDPPAVDGDPIWEEDIPAADHDPIWEEDIPAADHDPIWEEDIPAGDGDPADADTTHPADGDTDVTAETEVVSPADGDLGEHEGDPEKADPDAENPDGDVRAEEEIDLDANLCREGYVFADGACVKQGGGSTGGCRQSPAPPTLGALFGGLALLLLRRRQRAAPAE